MHIYGIREDILEKVASELMRTGLMGDSQQLRPESVLQYSNHIIGAHCYLLIYETKQICFFSVKSLS